MKKTLLTLLAAAVCLCGAAPATAAYPEKTINVIIAFAPGGPADLGMRVVAEVAAKQGVTINVTNKAAGGGSQAALDVLKARADGYTVLLGTPNLLTLTNTKNVGFKMSDFTPVADITNQYLSFCVRTDSGIKTFKDFVELAKKNPGVYNYSSPGAVSSQRLFMTGILNNVFPGTDMPNVPYSGGHEAATALLGSHVKADFGTPGNTKNYIQSGDFISLGVSSPKRLPELPDVPTFAEMFGDQYTWISYHGLFVKKGTPMPVVEKLSEIIGTAMKDPVVAQQFQKFGVTPDYLNPADFAKLVTESEDLVKKALKAIGMF